jgi:hypothetical protein
MTHLSSEQISSWAIGERNPDVERHVESCSQCREEILRLEHGLQAFRHSMHDWAKRNADSAVSKRHVPSSVPWTWVAVTAVAIGIVVGPAYLDMQRAEREAQNAQDSLLLSQVQERLTRTVPQSMEQLMELMDEGKEDQQ